MVLVIVPDEEGLGVWLCCWITRYETRSFSIFETFAMNMSQLIPTMRYTEGCLQNEDLARIFQQRLGGPPNLAIL